MIQQKSWILSHFEIFVTIVLKGAYGNRWRIALPWRRYLQATTAYLVNVFNRRY